MYNPLLLTFKNTDDTQFSGIFQNCSHFLWFCQVTLIIFYSSNLMKDICQPSAPYQQSPQANCIHDDSFLYVTQQSLFKEVSGVLKQKYLIPYENNTKTASGILFGPHAKPLVSLPVQPLGIQKDPIAIHFLVDTGAPTSYMSQKALLAVFGVAKLQLIKSFSVDIWGTKIVISRSNEHWQGINILGSNYFRKAQAHLECFYSQNPQLEYCKISKKQ